MTTLARRTLTGTGPDGTYLVATAKLEHLQGNERPYFSLTGEEWKSEKHQRNGWERSGLYSCGAMGDTLVEVWPELAQINALHLADDDGVPMHAEANGWYWYSDYDGKGTHLYPHHPSYNLTPHERAANYLRVRPDELPEGLDREQFTAFVDTLRPRWKAEAEAALTWLQVNA